jgi:hypothetical protein
MSNEVFMAREISYNEALLAEKDGIITALRAENERLRAALIEAADNLDDWGAPVNANKARAALEGREPLIK